MNHATLENTLYHRGWAIGKDEVMGSSPIISSTMKPLKTLVFRGFSLLQRVCNTENGEKHRPTVPRCKPMRKSIASRSSSGGGFSYRFFLS